MGVYTSWIAVKSDDIPNIQQTLMLSDTALLGLSPEQQKQEYDKHHVEAYLLESGWYVIQYREFSQAIIASMLKTSEKYDVIMFYNADNHMVSKAQYWQAKKLIWEVFWQPTFQHKIYYLEYSGAILDSFQTIIEKVQKKKIIPDDFLDHRNICLPDHMIIERVQNKAIYCYCPIDIPIFLVEKYLEQECDEFGIPKAKADITTSYLSCDEPYKLLQRYKISCS